MSGTVNVPYLLALAASSSGKPANDFFKTFWRLPLYQQNEILLKAASKEEKPPEPSTIQLYRYRLKIGEFATRGLITMIKSEGIDGFRDIVPGAVSLYLKLGPNFQFGRDAGKSIPQLVAFYGNGIKANGSKTIEFLELLDKAKADIKNVPNMLLCAANLKIQEVLDYLEKIGCES